MNTNLRNYVEEKINFWNRLTDKPEVTFPLSPEAKAEVWDCLIEDISPENLCCDGELSNAEVRKKLTRLKAVERELSLC